MTEYRPLPTDEAARAAGCYFDLASAERVRQFCRRFLRHSKGGWASQPFDLLPWQWRDFIAPVFGWKRADGRRRFNRVYVEIPKKNGKPLAIDTLIPTAAGWVSMGDIQPGETVFDETGSPCRVVAVSAVMHGKSCYRLTFADGTSVVAAGDHHWVTRSRTNPKRWVCRSTEQMYRTPPATDGGHNYYLPVAGALVGGAGQVEFDPYTFGFWLGNGHTINGELAVNNADVADVIRWMTGVRRVRPNGVGDSSLVVVNGLRNYTSGLGIKHYTQKYIPQCFLRAAVMYRWWLLQGLMDSDGCVGPKGQCVYVTGVPRLRDSVLELIRSLGFKTTCNYVDDTARTDRNCNGHWRILFTADSSTPISRLDRKQRALPAPSARRSRSLTNAIMSIAPVDSVPVRCIQVDSPSHQYLCGPGFTPTHNSTLCAALALYLLIADRESGSEVYSAAADREQASIVFNEAYNMVQASAGLSDVIVPVKSKKLLEFPHTRSIYKALSADVPTKEGLNIHGLIFDELHAQKTRKLWDTLKYGGRARSQPLFIAITTAGYDRESICYEQHLYARSVEKGDNDDIHFYPYIRAADLEDDWTLPETWHKANPSLGTTIPVDTFAQECREARMSPVAENTFRRYSLNQWTQQDVRWLNMFDWDRCDSIPSDEELTAAECFGGLDLATVDDMNAFVLFWPKYCACKCWFWVPEDCVRNRAVRQRFRYDGFIQRGLVRTTEGNTADHKTIHDDIVDIRAKYRKIKLVGVDRWNSSQIVRELMASGVKIEGFAQGFASMNGPAKDLETYVRTGKLQHGGNPVLRWHAGNVAVEIDSAANIKPSKKYSGEKIDGIVSLIMAIGLATKSIRRKSVYNEKGIDLV